MYLSYPIKSAQILLSRPGKQGEPGPRGRRGKKGKNGLSIQGPRGERGPPGVIEHDFSQYIVKILNTEELDYTWAQLITTDFSKTVSAIKLSYTDHKLLIQLSIQNELYATFIVIDQPGKEFIEVTSESGKNEISIDSETILPKTRINISCLWR